MPRRPAATDYASAIRHLLGVPPEACWQVALWSTPLIVPRHLDPKRIEIDGVSLWDILEGTDRAVRPNKRPPRGQLSWAALWRLRQALIAQAKGTAQRLREAAEANEDRHRLRKAAAALKTQAERARGRRPKRKDDERTYEELLDELPDVPPADEAEYPWDALEAVIAAANTYIKAHDEHVAILDLAAEAADPPQTSISAVARLMKKKRVSARNAAIIAALDVDLHGSSGPLYGYFSDATLAQQAWKEAFRSASPLTPDAKRTTARHRGAEPLTQGEGG